jgi:hypothetical protein
MNRERAQDVPWKRLQLRRVPPRSHLDSAIALYYDIYKYHISDYYVNPKSASRRRSVIDWIYCKGGRTMSTKWTFVRLAYYAKATKA